MNSHIKIISEILYERNELFMNTKIVSVWPCLGKSYLADVQQYGCVPNPTMNRFIDCESSIFRQEILSTDKNRENWVELYQKKILGLKKEAGKNGNNGKLVFLIPSHEALIRGFLDKGVTVLMYRPVWQSKKVYLQKLAARCPEEVDVYNETKLQEAAKKYPQVRAYIAMRDNFDTFYRSYTQLAREYKGKFEIINLDPRCNSDYLSDHACEIVCMSR
jgi:hypothetical protein